MIHFLHLNFKAMIIFRPTHREMSSRKAHCGDFLTPIKVYDLGNLFDYYLFIAAGLRRCHDIRSDVGDFKMSTEVGVKSSPTNPTFGREPRDKSPWKHFLGTSTELIEALISRFNLN